jgi:hypothetical protein
MEILSLLLNLNPLFLNLDPRVPLLSRWWVGVRQWYVGGIKSGMTRIIKLSRDVKHFSGWCDLRATWARTTSKQGNEINPSGKSGYSFGIAVASKIFIWIIFSCDIFLGWWIWIDLWGAELITLVLLSLVSTFWNAHHCFILIIYSAELNNFMSSVYLYDVVFILLKQNSFHSSLLVILFLLTPTRFRILPSSFRYSKFSVLCRLNLPKPCTHFYTPP